MFTGEVREILTQVREEIRKAAPFAEERISYQMPTFYYNGNLVHFIAAKSHLGFYPTPSGIIAFENELKSYKTSKGVIQFSYNKEIPYDLIARIVEFSVKENQNRPSKK